MRRFQELTPIQKTLDVLSSAARAYRAVTSQTELRKWWAPRVIMAKKYCFSSTRKRYEDAIN